VFMAWGSDWVGQAGATLPDIDHCRAALRHSLRRTLSRLPTDWRGCVLKRSVAELERRMDTDGRPAMDAGKPWDAKSGPVWISLRPCADAPKAPIVRLAASRCHSRGRRPRSPVSCRG
jgi:hypothetical protein